MVNAATLEKANTYVLALVRLVTHMSDVLTAPRIIDLLARLRSGISLDEAELSFVRQAVNPSAGNQTRAALLGISRDQLRYRLKKLEEVQGMVAADGET